MKRKYYIYFIKNQEMERCGDITAWECATCR